MLLNKKDIVRINEEIGETGGFGNEGSLDYVISVLKHKKPWLYELGHFVRALCVDHAFRDGNKRTALAIVLLYFDEKSIDSDKQRLVHAIHRISKNNVKSVNEIGRLIKSAIIY